MKNLIFVFSLLVLSSPKLMGQPCPIVWEPECDYVCLEDCESQACEECAIYGPSQGVPIDGGLSWLLLAGAGMATGNHLRKKKRKKSE